MNKEFIPYKESLKLKELGFDEPCLKLWEKTMMFTILVDPSEFKKVVSERYVEAPLYQQAFRWFREKYGLFVVLSTISYEGGPYLWFFEINSTTLPFGTDLGETDDFNTYEEAELACLIKLIELCQNKKK